MSNSGGISPVVHHQHLQLRDVVDDNSLEAVGVDVSSLLIGTITNTGHGDGSLETTANTSINTLWFAPGRVTDSDKLV